MRTLRLFISVLVMMISLCTWGYDFVIDGICYNRNGADAVSVVSVDTNCSGDLTIPVTITNDGTQYNVTSIGDYAFEYCSGLTSVTIPSSVTSIGEFAFEYCSGLTSVTIPSSMTSIGTSVFFGCSGLTSINIPNSVTRIGSYAFYGCTRLTSINIPNSVTRIGSCAFFGCSGLTSIAIPESVTSLGDCAFSGCSGLTSITIPESVTSIESCTFRNCSGLTSINIPNSVIRILQSAFENCYGLTSATIGKGVTDIDKWIFDRCQLNCLVVKTKTVPMLRGEFGFSSQITLLVPTGLKDAYSSATYWSNITDIRETAFDTDGITETRAFSIRMADSDSYLCYDRINGTLGTVSPESLDENNEDNTWMTTTIDGKKYIYNLGAKKYLATVVNNASRRMTPSSFAFVLTDVPTPVSITDGADGIQVNGSADMYFVMNEKLTIDSNLSTRIEEATGIGSATSDSSMKDGKMIQGGRIIIIKDGRIYNVMGAIMN